ncbi:hypothetical protein EDF56_106298 [Novosphingobium sp. PhB165]|uniref:hypothetical protein n=1 Tax=Novosphingobium sp. PhB165 TaxID=2485105 RepID=UPI001051A816|nr:hypothetical protein [Novosphingobium sp. PhB165]TCM17182.1 hypothetical protein EDF56_106298 [Novosphingobium sp. PhB165]
MTFLERTARALAASLDGREWEALDASRQRQFNTAARAVLETLHEPDEFMMEAGAEIVRHVGPDESDAAYRNDAANIWRLMASATLAQNGHA